MDCVFSYRHSDSSWGFGKATALGLLILSVVGCSPSGHPVTGKITLNSSEPLTAGTVTFYPDTGGAIPSDQIVYGTIGADGTYSVNAHRTKGAPPGKYRVTVVASTDQRPASARPNPMNHYSLVDNDYRDPETTPLRVEVVPNPPSGAYDLEVSPPKS